MAAPDSARPDSTRLSSGIPGLDEVLGGGFFRHRCYLLVGSAGTGKTITSLQWLLDGARVGEQALFISLSETQHELASDVKGFGWRLDAIDFENLSPLTHAPADLPVTQEEYTLFAPSEIEQMPTWERIRAAVEEWSPERLVIDSLTQLRFLSPDAYQFRKRLLHLVSFLRQRQVTTLLTYERNLHEEDPALGLSTDGVLHLRMRTHERRIVATRDVAVYKLRGSDFISGHHSMQFTDAGLSVFPHRIEEPGNPQSGGQLGTGAEGLDELLGGGIERGTTTLLVGPPGVGKTTLSMQLLRQAIHENDRAAAFTFEEAVDSVLERCRNLDIPIDDAVEDGRLRLERINPPAVSPDRFLAMLRHAVEEEGRRVVLLDSLRGYQLAMEAYPSPLAHLYNLITYLGRQGATAIIAEETGALMRKADRDPVELTFMVDNVLMLQYVEAPPRLLKAALCLKKRHGPFQRTVREFRIGSGGADVGAPIQAAGGLLAGVPTVADPAPALAGRHEQ